MELTTALSVLLFVVSIAALGALTWVLVVLARRLPTALDSLQGTLANTDKLSRQAASSGLLDQARDTMTSVHARVDDLAALQRELQDTSAALADVMTQLRDQQLGTKVGNLLSDASTLMADIGMLSESAASVLDTGRPLVQDASAVIESARRGVRSIAGGAQAVKEGVLAGIETLKGDD